MKQLYDQASTGSNDPKEKKIVNEQEQNKPVNEGDQPFEETDPSLKESLKKEKDETTSDSNEEITNKGDNDILNKDPGIQPE